MNYKNATATATTNNSKFINLNFKKSFSHKKIDELDFPRRIFNNVNNNSLVDIPLVAAQAAHDSNQAEIKEETYNNLDVKHTSLSEKKFQLLKDSCPSSRDLTNNHNSNQASQDTSSIIINIKPQQEDNKNLHSNKNASYLVEHLAERQSLCKNPKLSNEKIFNDEEEEEIKLTKKLKKINSENNLVNKINRKNKILESSNNMINKPLLNNIQDKKVYNKKGLSSNNLVHIPASSYFQQYIVNNKNLIKKKPIKISENSKTYIIN